MSISIQINSISRAKGIARIRVGKDEIEVPAATAAEFREWVKGSADENKEFLLRLALAIWIARDPDMSNPGQIVGRTITLNLQGTVNGANPVIKVA